MELKDAVAARRETWKHGALDTVGLTECSAEPFRHGGFARIDFQLWQRGSRQSSH